MYYEASALSGSNQAGSEEYGIQSLNLFKATAKMHRKSGKMA